MRRARLLPLVGLPAVAAAQRPLFAQDLPERFYDLYLGVELWQWIALGVLLLVSPLVALVVRSVVTTMFRVRYRFTHVKLSQTSTRNIRRSTSLLAAAVLWLSVVPELDLNGSFEHKLFFLSEIGAIAASIWLLLSLWDALCESLTQRTSHLDQRAEKLLIPVTRKLVQVLILLGGAFAVAAAFGQDLRGWLAGLGIGGLVIALAAKDSVENVFGSLTILFDMPFALGDWVKIDKVEGVVEEINLRSTRIRTFEDSVITLPNSNLIRASVENFGARRVRRQRFTLRVGFTAMDRVDRFLSELHRAVEKMPKVAPGRTIVELQEVGDTTLGILVQCFFEVPSFDEEMKMKGQLIRLVVRLANSNRILLPVPGAPPPPPPAWSPEEEQLASGEAE